jgi:Flp pilus assembly protein TadD
VAGAVIRLNALLTASGRPDEAAAVAQKWISEHPKDVAVRTFLGQQSIGKEDYKTAVKYLRAAADIEPENLAVLNDLAWAMAQSKDAKSVDYAHRAYRIAPNNPNIVNTYGWALVQSGDSHRAYRCFANPSISIRPMQAADSTSRRRSFRQATSRLRERSSRLLQRPMRPSSASRRSSF